MNAYENRIIGYTELAWEVRAIGTDRTVRVFATSQYNAERIGAVKLGVAQWLCSARLTREESGLRSLGLA